MPAPWGKWNHRPWGCFPWRWGDKQVTDRTPASGLREKGCVPPLAGTPTSWPSVFSSIKWACAGGVKEPLKEPLHHRVKVPGDGQHRAALPPWEKALAERPFHGRHSAPWRSWDMLPPSSPLSCLPFKAKFGSLMVSVGSNRCDSVQPVQQKRCTASRGARG